MTDKTVEGIFGLSLVALGFLLGYFWNRIWWDD